MDKKELYNRLLLMSIPNILIYESPNNHTIIPVAMFLYLRSMLPMLHKRRPAGATKWRSVAESLKDNPCMETSGDFTIM